MTSIELIFTTIFIVLSFFGTIILLVGAGQKGLPGACGIGIVSFTILTCFLIVFFYSRGHLSPAVDRVPTSLRQGTLYEKVYSQKQGVISFSRDGNHDAVESSRYFVWLTWENGKKNALYILKEDPPKRFTKNDKGEFLEVK